MTGRIVTLLLGVGLAISLAILGVRLSSLSLPGDQQGYEPVQPIAFSHGLHAGELQVDCLYCHAGAETSRFAGIPAAGTCMNCHKFVTAPLEQVREAERIATEAGRAPAPVVSDELAKLYDALAIDPLSGSMEPIPGRTPTPIAWTKVHNNPDFVFFDHRAHLAGGVSCQQCHGPVETMERVRQIATLSMGWCVNCHRDNQVPEIDLALRPAGDTVTGDDRASHVVHASTDCATCHY
ncbi:MAG: cytochrome c3 family protein [Vicinamibacterales bacterium]|jgi:hypothetical protein|nr:cytochrome c3 family protein [Vicinamibacterales bacterium]